jgi:hypothetical protein
VQKQRNSGCANIFCDSVTALEVRCYPFIPSPQIAVVQHLAVPNKAGASHLMGIHMMIAKSCRGGIYNRIGQKGYQIASQVLVYVILGIVTGALWLLTRRHAR